MCIFEKSVIETVLLKCFILTVFVCWSSAIIEDFCCRAIPQTNTAIVGTPSFSFSGYTKLQCAVECSRKSCQSFNFGNGECELFNTFFCDGAQTLQSRANFKYFDVEFGIFVQTADDYRSTTDCTVQNRCSPKCFSGTTTTIAPTTTTTPAPTTTMTTPAPTTTTTPAPTTTTTTPAPTTTPTTPAPTTTPTTPAPAITTTTSAPTTTTTTPAPTTTTTTPAPTTTTTTPAPTTTTTTTTTTPAPTTTTTTPAPTTTTTTPAPTTTTTTPAPTTTTTTPAPTTTTTTPAPTTTAAPTTPGPPGPGDVHSSCSVDGNCIVTFSECRDALCQCLPGYSYNPSGKDCVTSCATYGETFSLTKEHYLSGFNLGTPSVVSKTECIDQCKADPTCKSFDYHTLTSYCYLSYETKYNNLAMWTMDMFYEYYQRNCQ